MGGRVYLNLGSGQRPFRKPFVNVDIQVAEGRKPDAVASVFDLPMREGSVDLAVSHHCLEHMDAFREGQQAIGEAFRVLKGGGSLIVTVPDSRALAQRYLLREINGYTFRVNMHGAFMGSPFDRHLWSYDEEELKGKLLSAAKWSTVKRFDWRVIEGADIARDWWILAIEAIK